MGIRVGIWTSTVLRDEPQSPIEAGKDTKHLMHGSLLPEGLAHKSEGHTSVTGQVDRGNRINTLSDSSSHSSDMSSGHDLNAWEYTVILAQGKKTTRHWPKKEMFKSYECFSPVYQTESSAFPNRVFSFHASIFYITRTEKTTENILGGTTVYYIRETIHFSCSHWHQHPSGLCQ